MGFNRENYKRFLFEINLAIESEFKLPIEFLEKYKKAIEAQNFELAKAISVTLLEYSIDVSETHPFIKTINK